MSTQISWYRHVQYLQSGPGVARAVAGHGVCLPTGKALACYLAVELGAWWQRGWHEGKELALPRFSSATLKLDGQDLWVIM